MNFLILYLISLIITYFLYRQILIFQGEEAKYNPFIFMIIIGLIPIINIGVGLIGFFTEMPIPDFKFNYKKFFMIKE